MKALYGEMAEHRDTGQRAVPARLTELGYRFRRPEPGGGAPRRYREQAARKPDARPSEVRLPSPGRPLTLHHVKRPVE